MIVGVGALGCVSADLLARAGVGTITLVDRDLVEVSNLHRQTLYTQADAEAHTPKAVAAKARLEAVNPEITVHAHIADFSAANAEDLLEHGWALPDVLIDGSDNFETRYLINDLAVKDGIPYVYGGAIGTAGSTAVFVGPGGSRPCLRCVFKDPPAPGSQPTCESAGVLGPVSAIVGAAQAGEAIKILSGDAGSVSSTMLRFDLWRNERVRVDLSGAKSSECPCCGSGSFEFLESESVPPTVLCGRNAVQIAPVSGVRIDLDRVRETLAHGADVDRKPYMVRAGVEHSGQRLELTCFEDGRAIVEGTDDPGLARSVYDRYIGS